MRYLAALIFFLLHITATHENLSKNAWTWRVIPRRQEAQTKSACPCTLALPNIVSENITAPISTRVSRHCSAFPLNFATTSTPSYSQRKLFKCSLCGGTRHSIKAKSVRITFLCGSSSPAARSMLKVRVSSSAHASSISTHSKGSFNYERLWALINATLSGLLGWTIVLLGA